ncbi:uncharacterized protein [Panulirus ornatus]|uniref:uncharacterized protein n=1 Tax=Panulirus ornatus TaxID=150431 RepID=UPI003A892C1E
MKILPVMLLLATGASASAIEPRGIPVYSKCYDSANAHGSYNTFTTYVPDLRAFTYNNVISSVVNDGVWIYYDDFNYEGTLLLVAGIDGTTNFGSIYGNKASSLRFAGSQDCMNCERWILYEGTSYTGSEFYGTNDTPILGSFSARANSIITIGESYWTFYDGDSYTGHSVCVRPNHFLYAGQVKLIFGIYPFVTNLGLANNAIRSVKSGCHSKNMVASVELEVLESTNNTRVLALSSLN